VSNTLAYQMSIPLFVTNYTPLFCTVKAKDHETAAQI